MQPERQPSPYERYKVDIPEAKFGRHSVEKFTVGKEDAELANMRSLYSGYGGRTITPGTYTRLMRGGSIFPVVVMSDTPAEIRDHLGIIDEARRRGGDVLVLGLGLGMVTAACLMHPNVTRVTVVERDPEVIALVKPTLVERYGDRLEVIAADALTWKPEKGRRWTCAWYDIWDDITSDNLPEMKTFHRRFARRVDHQASWCRALCESRR